MYGLINKALRNMVIEKFGESRWSAILRASNVQSDAFLSMRQYDDQVTYDLVDAATETLGIAAEQCLEQFGYFWMTTAAPQHYDPLLQAAGTSAITFLQNLNDMHQRISSTFVGYVPPSFHVSPLGNDRWRVLYVSTRKGLTPFVVGLLRGVGERFQTPIHIEKQITNREDSGETTAFDVRLGES